MSWSGRSGAEVPDDDIEARHPDALVTGRLVIGGGGEEEGMPAVPRADPDEVIRALRILAAPGEVYELRVPESRRGTISGYFDDLEALAAAAARLSGTAPGIYATLNPVNRELLARAANRVKEFAKTTASDGNIIARRWILLDFDARRPTDISSTDAEHTAAIAATQTCLAWLIDQGIPREGLALTDSGNGGHVLIRVDLPNDDEATLLVRHIIEVVACRFDTETVKVDPTVYNASRIVKLYGTLAAKGDSMPDRPHRSARLLDVPARLMPVDVAVLRAIAAQRSPDPPRRDRPWGGRGDSDVRAFLAAHDVTITREKPWHGTRGQGTFLELAACVFNPQHNRGEAGVILLDSGMLLYKCHHASCTGKLWEDVRALLAPRHTHARQRLYASAPPKYDDIPPPTDDDAAAAEAGAEHADDRSSMSFMSSSQIRDWPAPLADEAFYGLAGEVVRHIRPATEADSAALLLQFLTAFGNVIGRNAHLCIESDLHFMNLFCVLVGNTSKGRKGTSWGRVRRVFELADPDWADSRIVGGLSSGEGLIWAVRDAIRSMEKLSGKKGEAPQYVEVLTDPGPSDKRLLVFEPEFSTTLRMLERQGNVLSGVIRQAWDTGQLNTMVKHDAAKATDAHVSIIGHSTRTELLRYLTRTEIADGFANRFLFACIRRSQCLPRGGALAEDVVRLLAEHLRRAIASARRVQQLTVSEATWRIWDRVYPILSEPPPGLLGAVIARAEAQVMRLAGLYALLDEGATIQPAHLFPALAVWDFCEESACYIFGDSLGDPVADEILAALRAAGSGGLTRTQIRDLFGRNKLGDEIGRALGVLLGQHLARSVNAQSGGRPVERWFATEPSMTTKTTEGSAAEDSAEPYRTTKTTKTTEAAANGGLSSFRSFMSYLELAKEAAASSVPTDGAAAHESPTTACSERVPGEDDDETPVWTDSAVEEVEAEAAHAETPYPTGEVLEDQELLALAALRGWCEIEYAPGHRIGGSEDRWQKFARGGLPEARRAARAVLERLADA
jgi:hypothetical protein